MLLPEPAVIISRFREHLLSCATFSTETWELLKDILSVHHLKKGSYVIEEGKICRHIDFIASGSFRIFSNKDGIEVTTGLFIEGSFVTNMKSLTSSSPSQLFAQAMEDATIVRLYKDAMIGLYKESAEMQTVGRTILEAMVVQENEWKEMYTLYDPEERYQFLMTKNPELLQRFSLQYIASFLGIRRETLSRICNRSSRSSF